MALLFTYLSFLFLCFHLPHLSSSYCSPSLNSCKHVSTSPNRTTYPKSFNLCCNETTNQTMIRFNNSGPLFQLKELSIPQHKLVFLEPELSSPFNKQNCSFLYSFILPYHNFNLSFCHDLLLAEQQFFNCSKLEDNFEHELLLELNRITPCKNYNFYFANKKLDSQIFQALPSDCKTNRSPSYEWTFSFSDDGILDLLSVGFSNHLELNLECFNCEVIGSGCSVNGGHKTVCQEYEKKKRKQRIELITIGVSAGTGASLVVFGFLFWYKRWKRNKKSTITLGRSYSAESSSMREDTGYTSIFSYRELQEATDNFSESKELGDGGFGTVYKGILQDGRTVAIKRLYGNNYKRAEQFMNEVAILSRLRHQNLVSLYGSTSRHSRELLLVYEFIPNGTVADHLHGHLSHSSPLPWPIRLNIAIQTATALTYLHAIQPPIIHRDVKTTNILLDQNFNVKVADFGLSRLVPVDATHVSTAPQGTPGYLDPVYYRCYRLTDKSDVYSFGVVLMELISSKPAVDVRRSEINLASMAVDKMQRNELEEFVDWRMFGEEEEGKGMRMVKVVGELAFRCLQGERDLRPAIKEVLEVLEGVVRLEDGLVVERGGGGGKRGGPESPDTVMEQAWRSEDTTPGSSL
ncbi:Non-specific serine/threonine protein kinase protein [Dioscorea alata]|uniref:Non-specific serine/threonine protein kinase protein n=1 Tax=Dioscorea alata TaxID=55571 RepID=A0ACB7UE13_DIOAL|nr:Non-specific serine/threonine protein kinase protein [Dioscorea alata]